MARKINWEAVADLLTPMSKSERLFNGSLKTLMKSSAGYAEVSVSKIKLTDTKHPHRLIQLKPSGVYIISDMENALTKMDQHRDINMDDKILMGYPLDVYSADGKYVGSVTKTTSVMRMYLELSSLENRMAIARNNARASHMASIAKESNTK